MHANLSSHQAAALNVEDVEELTAEQLAAAAGYASPSELRKAANRDFCGVGGVFAFFGLPPFAPFARAAMVFASLVTLPPSLPRDCAALFMERRVDDDRLGRFVSGFDGVNNGLRRDVDSERVREKRWIVRSVHLASDDCLVSGERGVINAAQSCGIIKEFRVAGLSPLEKSGAADTQESLLFEPIRKIGGELVHFRFDGRYCFHAFKLSEPLGLCKNYFELFFARDFASLGGGGAEHKPSPAEARHRIELTYSGQLIGAFGARKTSMRNQELFNLMSREHGLTLLESEMDEIERVVARMLATDRGHEAARQSCPELGAVNGWTSALERAASALEYRSEAAEEDAKLQSFRRNEGLAAVLREGVSNDRKALAVIQDVLRSSIAKLCNSKERK